MPGRAREAGVTLWPETACSSHYACLQTLWRLSMGIYTKKREATSLLTLPLLGGGYLLSHFRSTIGVVRLNFSVRNGKRWDPHAITTLSLPFQPKRRIGLRRGCDDLKRPSGERSARTNPATDDRISNRKTIGHASNACVIFIFPRRSHAHIRPEGRKRRAKQAPKKAFG